MPPSHRITLPKLVAGFVPFIYQNRPGKSYPVVRAFFAAQRAAAPDFPLGAAGFCWGGKHAVLLAGDEDAGQTDASASSLRRHHLLDAAFVGHPSALVIPGDIEKMKVPVSFAFESKDPYVSTENAEVIRRIVENEARPEAQRGELRVYEGCGHGFCVRADSTDKDVARQAEEAAVQCIDWLKKRT